MSTCELVSYLCQKPILGNALYCVWECGVGVWSEIVLTLWPRTTLECHQLPCFLIATDTPTTLGVCTTPCPLEGLFLLSLCTFVWTKSVCRGGWVKYDFGGFLHIPRTQVAGQWIPFSILHLAVGNCQPSKQVQKPMWGSQKEISPHFSRQCHLTTFYVFTADILLMTPSNLVIDGPFFFVCVCV